jgi:hypothetical protein
MTNDGPPDIEYELSELRRAEHLQLVAARAARRAERRRLIRLGAWPASFTIIVGLANAWAPSGWVWFLMVTVLGYISLRRLDRAERLASVRARPVRREVIVTGLLTFAGLALLVPAHVLLLQPALGHGIGLAVVTAAAVFGVWTLGVLWATR